MHAGYLKTKCHECKKRDTETNDALGCNPNVAAANPAWQDVDSGRLTSYFNCPSLFIPQTVWGFFDAYKGYHGSRFALPKMGEQPHKYLSMCDYYEHYLSHYQEKRIEKDRARDKMGKLARFRSS